MRGTFRNIASTLAEAGAQSSDVVEINSYRVDLQQNVLLAVAAEFLEGPSLSGLTSASQHYSQLKYWSKSVA